MKKIAMFVVLIFAFSVKLNAESLIRTIVTDSEMTEDMLRVTGVAFVDGQEFFKENVTTLHLQSKNDKIVYDAPTKMLCEEQITKEFQSPADISCSKYVSEINFSTLNLEEGFYDVIVQVQTPKEAVSEVMYINADDGFKSFYFNNMRYDFGVKDKRAYINVVNEKALIKTDVTEYKIADNVLVLNGVGYLNDISAAKESDLHHVVMFKNEKGDTVYKQELKTVQRPVFMWLYSHKIKDYSSGFFESNEIDLSSLEPGMYDVYLYAYDDQGNYGEEQLYTSHIKPEYNQDQRSNLIVEGNRLKLERK